MDRKTPAFVTWLLVCGVLSSCGRDSLPERDFERVAHPGPTAAPLLVIGVDGLEWNVILAMLRDGSLPHLDRLMRQGVYGRLNTLRTPKSPIVWTSVATGKIPAKHGILDFTRRDNEGNRQLYNNGDRKTKAVWNTFDLRRRSIREPAQDIGGAGELYLLFSDLLLQCPYTVLKKEHWIRRAISRELRRQQARTENESGRFLPYDEEYDPPAESTEPKHEVLRKLLCPGSAGTGERRSAVV